MTSEMGWENWYLRFIIIVPLVVADLCPEPEIPNGEVRGEKGENLFFGEITCNIGYHLVGASKTIKCRHGVWSHKELPVCSAVGTCETLPKLKNGRNVPIQGSRGSAYRFKCNRGFKRFGERRTHCSGSKWSHEHMPTCAKATCDWIPLEVPYGEGRAMLGGAVHKYRCNNGVEMEGSDTLVCDGENWNGTVPHCNVAPTKPELELIVSGNVVTAVKPGDWVLVTCQASGGHPVADIGITVDGVSAGSKDFRNLRNSFTFTATEEDDGKTIVCTALNKIGTEISSTVVQVYTPPATAAISGPETVHHNDEFTFECAVEGGNPAPAITWQLRDHLGQVRDMQGNMVGPGLSRMLLKTGSKERMLSVNCVGENSQGVVSHTMYVHTHYLPASIEITGPTTVTAGEEAHLSCETSGAFPAPALRFRISKSGKGEEERYIVGDSSSETLPDGGLITSTKMDIRIDEDNEETSVECLAVVEGLGERKSNKHNIKHIKKIIEIMNDKYNDNIPNTNEVNSLNLMPNDDENEIEDTDLPLKNAMSMDNIVNNMVDNPILNIEDENEIKEIASPLKNTASNEKIVSNPTIPNDKDTKLALKNTKSYDYIVDSLDQQKHAQNKDVISSFDENSLRSDNKADVQEETEDLSITPEQEDTIEAKKVLWIPYKPVDDIQDYQSVFQPDSERSDDTYEEFLRPSDIPEAPMLKQEKVAKPTFVNNPLSASADFSSSPRISIHLTLFIVSACLSIISH